MILAAHCLESPDVPPVMIEVSDGDGYEAVKNKIREGMNEHRGENGPIEISEVSCRHTVGGAVT